MMTNPLTTSSEYHHHCPPRISRHRVVTGGNDTRLAAFHRPPPSTIITSANNTTIFCNNNNNNDHINPNNKRCREASEGELRKRIREIYQDNSLDGKEKAKQIQHLMYTTSFAISNIHNGSINQQDIYTKTYKVYIYILCIFNHIYFFRYITF
ncbi:hypothetical protein BDC45DRAFT_327662 [Circinella umbellata]|nr:hypothetical protein BDC45DRAFT_327662 [Circinella umbellata]